jgi:hypothetical protein
MRLLSANALDFGKLSRAAILLRLDGPCEATADLALDLVLRLRDSRRRDTGTPQLPLMQGESTVDLTPYDKAGAWPPIHLRSSAVQLAIILLGVRSEELGAEPRASLACFHLKLIGASHPLLLTPHFFRPWPWSPLRSLRALRENAFSFRVFRVFRSSYSLSSDPHPSLVRVRDSHRITLPKRNYATGG